MKISPKFILKVAGTLTVISLVSYLLQNKEVLKETEE